MIRIIFLGLPSLLLAGCVVGPPVGLTDLAAYSSPADPTVATGGSHYHSVIGDYTPRMPTEPEGWRGSGVEMAPVGEGEPAEEEQTSEEAQPMAEEDLK